MTHRKPICRISNLPAFLSLFLFAIVPIFAAATGSIEGRVFNPRSGAFAENARVSIEGTEIVTFTDADGFFHLDNVSAGTARLRIFYTGYLPQFEAVAVTSGETTRREFNLGEGAPTPSGAPASVVKLDAFTVSESREMEASAIAINEQRFASNIKQVVSTDEFGAIAEGNAGEFLRFLPGLIIDYNGVDARSVSIDGAPEQNTPVTLGGVNLPASNRTGRQVEVAMFNLNNISRIEVSLSPTPDSPGSALAGSINLVPRSSFERTRPVLNVSAFLTMRDNMLTLSRQPYQYGDFRRVIKPGFDVSWVVPVNRRFGFSVAVGNSTKFSTTEANTNTWRGLSAATNGTAFPHTTPGNPYLSAYQVRVSPNSITRSSLGLTLDYRLSDRDRLSYAFQFAGFDSWTGNRNLQFNPTRIVAGTFSPTFVQGVAGAGQLVSNSTTGRLRQSKTHMHVLNWRHEGPVWKLDAGMGRAFTKDALRSRDKGLFETIISRRTNMTIGFDQVTDERPGYISVIDNATKTAVDPYVLDDFSLVSVAETPLRSSDINFTGFANARRDFDWTVPITLRAGLDFRQSIREYRTGNRLWNYSGANVRGSAAQFVDPTSLVRKSPFGFPPIQFVDYKAVYKYFEANPSQFTFSEDASYRSFINGSKHAKEMVSSAYIRADVALMDRRLNLVGGVRFEQTNVEGEGPLTDLSRNVKRDSAGKPILNNGVPVPITTVPLEISKLTLLERAARAEKEYLRMFPSLNASYNILDNLIARAAFSTSIGRPDFDQYAGGISLPNTDNLPSPTNSIGLNNAAIKPWTATTYRVRLEYYFRGVGQFSVGAYRRNYKNFFGQTEFEATPEFLALYSLDPSTYGDYSVTTQYNIPGTVGSTGWELNYKQSLTFLPNWARGIQVFGNISFRRMDNAEDMNVRGFYDIPYSGSWGISLTRQRFNIRANINYVAARRLGRVSGASIPEGTFNYNPSYAKIDLLGEYRLTRNLSVFATARDIEDTPDLGITIAPAEPARLRTSQKFGSFWTVGLRGIF